MEPHQGNSVPSADGGSCWGPALASQICAVKWLWVGSRRHAHRGLPKQVNVKPVHVMLRIKVRFLLQVAREVKNRHRELNDVETDL